MPEFIHGNRDGAFGTHATYTICRLFISRAELNREIEGERIHPGYRVLHRRDPADPNKVVDAWPQNTPDGILFTNINRGKWPGCCPAAKQMASAGRDAPQRRLAAGGSRVVEYIHGHRDGKGGRNEHYTVCRLGVPQEVVEWEVREGLHPGYQVSRNGRGIEISSKKGVEHNWECGMVCALET